MKSEGDALQQKKTIGFYDNLADEDPTMSVSDYTILVKIFKRREEDCLRMTFSICSENESVEGMLKLGQELSDKEIERQKLTSETLARIKTDLETELEPIVAK
jgi:hypothetical protein